MINLGFILLLVILVIFLYTLAMYNPKIEEFIAPVRAIRILKASGLTTVREVMGSTVIYGMMLARKLLQPRLDLPQQHME